MKISAIASPQNVVEFAIELDVEQNFKFFSVLDTDIIFITSLGNFVVCQSYHFLTL